MKFTDDFIKDEFPGTVQELERYDAELQKYGAEIVNVRITDTYWEHISVSLQQQHPLIVTDPKSIIHELARMGKACDINDHEDKLKGHVAYDEMDICRGLYEVIASTCKNCGSHCWVIHTYDYHIDNFLCGWCASFCERDPINLVRLQSEYYKQLESEVTGENDRHKPSKVRVLNPFGEFDYVRTSHIRFHNGELYMLTDRMGYSEVDVSSDLGENVYSLFPNYGRLTGCYIIRVKFAGVELSMRDVHGERIYTGDILVALTGKAFGMAMHCPLAKTKCAVFYGGGDFPTYFDDYKDWEIRGNIILNNPDYSGNQEKDYDSYMTKYRDMWLQLMK